MIGICQVLNVLFPNCPIVTNDNKKVIKLSYGMGVINIIRNPKVIDLPLNGRVRQNCGAGVEEEF